MDVASWLRNLGLERYEAAFRENDVGAEDLRHLTAEDLEGLGVAAIGHRRRLLVAIAKLRDDAASLHAVRSDRRSPGHRPLRPNGGRSLCCSVTSSARHRSLPGSIRKSCAKY